MFIRRWNWWPIVAGLGGLLAIAVAVLFPMWRTATKNGGQQEAEPFRIAGNLYYVGANDIAAFLITGPEGHVLIDGGYPGTATMIMASIKRLGFDIKDVKILLNSEPHYDHAGGLAELQDSSGAQIWASEASASVLETGGADNDDKLSPLNLFVWSGLTKYAAPTVHHRFTDGTVIRLGPIELTAHITPGHTRGCTTWSFVVHEGERALHVVSACSLQLMPDFHLAGSQKSAQMQADFIETLGVLRSLPVDIWVTSHARAFGRYRKFVARASAKDSVEPFIDRAGYLAYIDEGEKAFRDLIAEKKRGN